MNLYNLAKGCAECRVCEEAAYQTPPVLYAGQPTAPIVALGQNPGEIKPGDVARQEWMKIFEHLPSSDLHSFIPIWYMWDFYGSPGYKRLSRVFGKDWMLNGEIIWSNVVRCRTILNAAPSIEMFSTCKSWTNQLLEGRKGIIMVGGRARDQILGADARKLEWGAPKRHPELGFILAIKHYAAWEDKEEALSYKRAVDKLKEHIL